MNVFENMLSFADLQVAAQNVAPIFLRDTFLNFLFGLRLSGLIISLILIILVIVFRFKLLKLKIKKVQKVGLSGLEKGSLLYETKKKTIFKKIDDYISFENILYWKLALVEIDSYFNNVMTEIGFKGNDIQEKLCQIPKEYLSNIEDMKKTHQKVSDILNDNNYLLTREETEKLIDVYKQGIEELGKL